MELRIENGVLCGDIPDGYWHSNWELEDRLVVLTVPEGVTAYTAQEWDFIDGVPTVKK